VNLKKDKSFSLFYCIKCVRSLGQLFLIIVNFERQKYNNDFNRRHKIITIIRLFQIKWLLMTKFPVSVKNLNKQQIFLSV
jgi:hypothetical protein